MAPQRTRPGTAPRPPAASGNIAVIRPSRKAGVSVAGVLISHADRPLWPGISKQDLAEYWQAVAGAALPGIARRPLSILRCPDGIDGREKFFQKNGHGIMPTAVRDGTAARQPFLAIDDAAGLAAMAQMSAIELHAWGAAEADPTRPDQLVFDLDPGEGVPWSAVIKAAHDTRERLAPIGLAAFCRTTGGKGLHVVVPLQPAADWSVAKPFCNAFADIMARDEPDRFLAHLKIADRTGRILVDWLRNGLGATAVASFSPRARPGATVATPLAWEEVTPKLDPARFTIRTVPERLAKLRTDPWAGFDAARRPLPALGRATPAPARHGANIVVAARPRPRRH